jgi:minichromosome maintenance protein 10
VVASGTQLQDPPCVSRLTLATGPSLPIRKRTLPHSHLQDHLAGRYYLAPSLLYSVIRLSRDGATYDVPVEGDWITIAVVAERGAVKVSGAKEAVSEDEDEETRKLDVEEKVKQGDAPLSKEAMARKRWIKRRGLRKYINLKLCALPPRNRSMGTKEVEGDAMLQLLLFEADARIHDGARGEEVRYKGGSGGAYEKWCNLTVGSVIAILNPRVLRPLRVSDRDQITENLRVVCG